MADLGQVIFLQAVELVKKPASFAAAGATAGATAGVNGTPNGVHHGTGPVFMTSELSLACGELKNQSQGHPATALEIGFHDGLYAILVN